MSNRAHIRSRVFSGGPRCGSLSGTWEDAVLVGVDRLNIFREKTVNQDHTSWLTSGQASLT